MTIWSWQIYYTLDAGHRVVAVPSFDFENLDIKAFMDWARNVHDNRQVAISEFACGASVSTVFLGMDQRHFGSGPPLVFETMVFGLPDGDMSWRYSSWDDAVNGHMAIMRKVGKLLERDGFDSNAATVVTP